MMPHERTGAFTLACAGVLVCANAIGSKFGSKSSPAGMVEGSSLPPWRPAAVRRRGPADSWAVL